MHVPCVPRARTAPTRTSSRRASGPALTKRGWGMATHTLWGPSQESKRIMRGVMWYSTASHGGYHVATSHISEIAEPLRSIGQSDSVGGKWYEEDCDWSVVALTWPAEIQAARIYLHPDSLLHDARRMLRSVYPDEYEALTGTVVTPEESYVRAEQVEAEAAFATVTDANERAKLLVVKAYCPWQYRHAVSYAGKDFLRYRELMNGYYVHAPHVA